MGMGGVLHTEITSALYGQAGAPPVVMSAIGGLGGRDIVYAEYAELAGEALTATESGETPPPRLLYTENELREMRKMQAIAAVESLEEEEGEP